METEQQLRQESESLRARVRELESALTEIGERSKRTQDELRVAEERWRALVENTTDSIMLLDRGGAILDINRPDPDLTREEVIGRSVYEFCPPECREDMRAAYERAIATGEPAMYETLYVTKDGETRNYEGSIGPIHRNGDVAMLAVSCRDITDRKLDQRATRESEERFRMLFEQAADAVVLMDLESRKFAQFNAVACRSLGYTPGEFAQLTLPDIEAGESPEETTVRIHRLRREGEDEFETQIRAKDDGLRKCIVKVRLVSLGGQDFALAIWHDITELRKLQASLLEVGDRQRRELGYNLHDDLGQHLTGLRMLCNVLARNLERDCPGHAPVAHEISDLADGAISKIKALVHGLSLVEPVEEGLALALQQLATNSDAWSETALVTFNGEHDVTVSCEETAAHLYRIAEEAVNNALKHSDASRIELTLSRDNGQLALAIEDDGNGLLHAHNNAEGLGVRTMNFRADVIGGKLTIDSSPGKGTTVRCACPQPA